MSENLPHYLNAWNLSDPEPLATTVTSYVYTVTHDGSRAVLKLLTPYGEEEQVGAAGLRYFDGEGAVRLLREDERAHLLEYADGEDLVGLVKSGHDEQATAIIADVLNRLHSVKNPSIPAEIVPLRRWFRELFKKAEDDQRSGVQSIYTKAAPMADALLADPRDVCVLHGDIHHENIRFHAQRGWLAFDPKGLVGERTFDTANILRNPLDMPDLVENETRLLRTAELLAQKMNLDFSRILSFTFVFACLSAAWLHGDGEEARGDLSIARLIEPHLPR